jgi:hypothetical protein
MLFSVVEVGAAGADVLHDCDRRPHGLARGPLTDGDRRICGRDDKPRRSCEDLNFEVTHRGAPLEVRRGHRPAQHHLAVFQMLETHLGTRVHVLDVPDPKREPEMAAENDLLSEATVYPGALRRFAELPAGAAATMGCHSSDDGDAASKRSR